MQSGGSRGLGRTYFFLAELLLLELDLLPLLLLFELELDELFFAPPDFEAALAMLTLLPARTTDDSRGRFRYDAAALLGYPDVPLLFSWNK